MVSLCFPNLLSHSFLFIVSWMRLCSLIISNFNALTNGKYFLLSTQIHNFSLFVNGIVDDTFPDTEFCIIKASHCKMNDNVFLISFKTSANIRILRNQKITIKNFSQFLNGCKFRRERGTHCNHSSCFGIHISLSCQRHS